MQARQLKKKVAVFGTGLFAASLCALPFAGSASAQAGRDAAEWASIGDNAAVNVQAEYNCSTHTLYTDVKNKLDKDITPKVMFDQMTPDAAGYPPLGGSEASIKPGESYKYMFGFSGGNRPIPVSVAVDGYDPVEIDPFANCNDPVTFTVTGHSSKMVRGYLSNTNPDYPQKVTLAAGFNGQKQDVTLLEGSSVEVAIPFNGNDQTTIAFVSVSTGPSYSSSYMVDLTTPVLLPSVEAKAADAAVL